MTQNIPSRSKSWAAFLAVLILSLMLAAMAILPPRAKGPDTSADQFSAARAMEDLRIIAAKPHPTGSSENAKVRDYLARRMKDMGLEVRVAAGPLDARGLARLNRWSGREDTEQTLHNVIGVMAGADSKKPALLLMAHHDTVWESPGAADDSIGIAATLEIIRALKESGNLQRDVIVLFTDAEEVGLVGARQFFTKNPLNKRVGLVINFEARGGGGTANMFETSRENGELARLYARHVKTPSLSSLSVFVYNALPNGTDMTEALERGYPAYNIANIGRAEYYHSPKIIAEAVDARSLQHMGAQGLDLARAITQAQTLPAKSPDAVFFDVFGLFTVVYAPFWGWVFLAGAGLFYGVSIKGALRVKDIGLGILKIIGFYGLGGAGIYGLNALSNYGQPHKASGVNYYDRLAAIPKLEAMALLFIIAMFALFFTGSRTLKAAPKNASENLSENAPEGIHENTSDKAQARQRFGAAIPIFILAIAGQALAPTATYFINLTLLFCGLSAWFLMQANRGRAPVVMRAISVIFAAVVTGYMIGLGHLLLLGVGPSLPAVAILPAALAALALLPLSGALPKRVRYGVIMMAIALAVFMALWIRFDVLALTVPSYRG